MTDREYLMALKAFKNLRMDKEKWATFGDMERHDLIELMEEVNAYSNTYRKNKKHIDIDPYGEENWEN